MSGLTVNVLDELSDPMGVDVVVSPEKEAVKVYEFDGSLGVMVQLAKPLEFVVPVQDSEPLRVKVTGSFATGAPVLVLVRVPETGVGDEKLPVTGLMVSVVGVVVIGAVVAAICSSSTESP